MTAPDRPARRVHAPAEAVPACTAAQCADDLLDEYVDAEVAKAPPLTPGQKLALAAILGLPQPCAAVPEDRQSRGAA